MIIPFADFVARRERRQRSVEELARRPGDDDVNEPDGRSCPIILDAAPPCPPVPLRASGAIPLSFPKPR